MVQNERPKVVERQRAILDAAAHLFRSKGYYKTGMRDIAAALGMTVGNLYYYFASKEELLAFCQQEATEHLLALAQWSAGLKVEVEQRLYLLVVGHLCCLNEGIRGSLAHLQIEDLPEKWRPGILEGRDRYENEYRMLIEAGKEAGRLQCEDAKVSAMALLGAVNWTVKWYRAEGPHTALEIGHQFASQLVRGLLSPQVEFIKPEYSLPDFVLLPFVPAPALASGMLPGLIEESES